MVDCNSKEKKKKKVNTLIFLYEGFPKGMLKANELAMKVRNLVQAFKVPVGAHAEPHVGLTSCSSMQC